MGVAVRAVADALDRGVERIKTACTIAHGFRRGSPMPIEHPGRIILAGV
jgi:hypothetical protein